MADYLGGELDDARCSAFDACLAEDPELAREVADLRKAIDALRALEEPDTVRSAPAVESAGHRLRLGMALRYAAVILMAFGAGYLTRNAFEPSVPVETPGLVRPAPAENKAAEPASGLETRMAKAYASQPDRSGLARALLALACAGNEP
jgi:anti-sigma factor RsiW